MKLRTTLYTLLALTTSLSLTGACGGEGDGSSSNGDGDGDGDLGGSSGDGDGDTGDGDTGDGDGDAGDGDGDAGDGDGDMGGSPGDGDGDVVGDGDGDVVGDGDGDVVGDGDGDTCPETCPNDGDPCTEDACNPETGECGIPRSGNVCNDGLYCNGDDTCEDGECSGHTGDPCGDEFCDEGTNSCHCTLDEHCDDGVFCNGEEVCNAGSCEDAANPTCPGGPAFCYAPLDRCVDCIPGTFTCDFDRWGTTDAVIACLSNGTWEDEGSSGTWSASCYAPAACDAATGTCSSMYMHHPRDKHFDIPDLLRGPVGPGVGRPTQEVFDGAGLYSEFG